MWSGYYVGGDEFTYLGRGIRSCLGCGLYGGNIAADKDCNQPTTDLLPTRNLDISSFDHGIGRLHHGYPTTRFYHPQRLSHCSPTYATSSAYDRGKMQKIGGLEALVKLHYPVF